MSRRTRRQSNTYLLDREGMILRGRYRVLELIGTGGMGSVWVAEQLALRKKVVVKFHEAWMPNQQPSRSLARFVREAKLLASVRHRNVTELYEVGHTDEGEPFLIMEKLEGAALSDLMRAGDFLPLEQTLEIGVAIATGLEAVHAAGVLHRDVKPENIFLHEAEEDLETIPKLLDFGLAGAVDATRLTESKYSVGTPGYMPPEQAFGVEGLDGRADIYGLAVTLYEMLAATLPTHGATTKELLECVVRRDPTPLTHIRPDLAGPVSDTLMRALQRDRERRPKDARTFRRQLQALLDEHREATGYA